MFWGEIEESERPSAARNWPQDTWLVQPVLCHWAMTTRQPKSTVCTTQVVLMCFSHTHSSHLAFAIRTLLGVDQKILTGKFISSQNSFKGWPERQHMLSGCQVCNWCISVPPVQLWNPSNAFMIYMCSLRLTPYNVLHLSSYNSSPQSCVVFYMLHYHDNQIFQTGMEWTDSRWL